MGAPTTGVASSGVTAPRQDLTRDHKPELEDEGARIRRAGGRVVVVAGCHRVSPRKVYAPGLNMSRSLGDAQSHACGVSAQPEAAFARVACGVGLTCCVGYRLPSAPLLASPPIADTMDDPDLIPLVAILWAPRPQGSDPRRVWCLGQTTNICLSFTCVTSIPSTTRHTTLLV